VQNDRLATRPSKSKQKKSTNQIGMLDAHTKKGTLKTCPQKKTDKVSFRKTLVVMAHTGMKKAPPLEPGRRTRRRAAGTMAPPPLLLIPSLSYTYPRATAQ
jgi:hypothetical protein